MSAHIKLVSLICGAGISLGGGIPWVLKHYKNSSANNGSQRGQVSSITSNSLSPALGTSPIDSSSQSKAIQEQRAKSKEEGNCVVLNNSEEIINILWKFDKFESDYTAVYCRNTNTETSIKISNWTGIFSDELLLNSWSLKRGDRFNITTKTTILDSGNYQTIFSGDRMESPITGEWGESTKTDEGKSVMVVKIFSPEDSQESIYLLFDENR